MNRIVHVVYAVVRFNKDLILAVNKILF